MSKKEKRNFSAEQKIKIALELIKSDLIIAQLSKKHKIIGKTIQNWKAVLGKCIISIWASKSSERI